MAGYSDLEKLNELETKIQSVSGYTLEELLEKFKQGYTLKEPDYVYLPVIKGLEKINFRCFTEEEQEAHDRMLDRLSIDTGIKIYIGEIK